MIFGRNNTFFTFDDQHLIEKASVSISTIFENIYAISIRTSKEKKISMADPIDENSANFQYETGNKPTTNLNFLFQLDSLSPEKISQISMIRKSLEYADSPLKVFANNISK